MIPVYRGHDKNMLELQKKLRESEEERIRLEERFRLIQQESRLRHEACINKLRMRYIEFLEEQRIRDERNHKLLSALDRVDESLASISAETDRLYTLRKEYDASLMRTDVDRRQIGSVTGDSGVVSQNEDGQMRKSFRHSSFVAPESRYDVERRLRNFSAPLGNSASLYNFSNNSRAYLDYPSSSLYFTRKPFGNHDELLLQNRQAQAANHGENNELQMPLRKPENHTWGGGKTINDLDQVRKRDACENLLSKELLQSLQCPKRLEIATTTPKLTSILGTMLNSKEERIGSVLENELDRYIHKIRSLHDNSYPHSLEEVEQNTSGDLLNVTLSDDGLDHLSIEEKMRTQEIPTDVKAILAIADDLVCNTMDDIHVEDDTSDAGICPSADKITTNVAAGQTFLNEPTVSNHTAVINATVSKSDTQIVTSTAMCASVSKDKITDNVAILTTKLNPSAKNIQTLTKLTTIDDSQRSNSAQSQKGDVEFPEKHEIPADTARQLEIVDSNELHDERQEADSYNNSETANEVESWNTENLEIEHEKVLPNDNTELSNKSSDSNADIPSLATNAKVFEEENRDEDIVEKSEINITHELITDTNIQSNDKDKINIDNTHTVGYNTAEQNYECPPVQQFVQPYEQESQVYPQDPNQMYEYNNEQYHDLQQQYQYDQNLSYEQDPNEQYQYDQHHSQYIQDPNAQYQDQQYTNNENQQYVINSDEQYHEYSADPNQHYQSETYVQDPNATYDTNAIYTYPTQNDGYTANNTYDELPPPIPHQYHQEYQEQSDHNEIPPDVNGETATNYHTENLSNEMNYDNVEEKYSAESSGKEELVVNEDTAKKPKDVIKYILDSDTESTVEKNISNTDSDFNFD